MTHTQLRMTNRKSQGIRRVSSVELLGSQHQLNYSRHLLLVRPAVAGDCGFYLSWVVFNEFQSVDRSGKHDCTACLSQFEGGNGVFSKKDLFNDESVRFVVFDFFIQSAMQTQQSLIERTIAQAKSSMSHQFELVSHQIHDS